MFDQRKEFKFITKCDGIITNCDRLVYRLLQITTALLLSEARFITSCDRYYKVRWTVITTCATVFLLQNADESN